MNEAVEIALALPIGIDCIVSPGWPMVGTKGCFHVLSPFLDRQIDIFAPFLAVSDLCASKRVQIMQGVTYVFGLAKGLELGKVEHHFGWCFGFGRIDEFDGYPVDDPAFSGQAFYH